MELLFVTLIPENEFEKIRGAARLSEARGPGDILAPTQKEATMKYVLFQVPTIVVIVAGILRLSK